MSGVIVVDAGRSRSTCLGRDAYIHDHAKQYDNDETCHDKRNDGKLHGYISRNGYGNAIIGRYGGCFEEDIRMFMCERAYHITGLGCTGKFCANSYVRKGNARYQRG